MGVLRFWFDRGVDGFRIDVLWHIIKAASLNDNPINAEWTPDRTQRDRLIQLYSTDQPEDACNLCRVPRSPIAMATAS